MEIANLYFEKNEPIDVIFEQIDQDLVDQPQLQEEVKS